VAGQVQVCEGRVEEASPAWFEGATVLANMTLEPVLALVRRLSLGSDPWGGAVSRPGRGAAAPAARGLRILAGTQEKSWSTKRSAVALPPAGGCTSRMGDHGTPPSTRGLTVARHRPVAAVPSGVGCSWPGRGSFRPAIHRPFGQHRRCRRAPGQEPGGRASVPARARTSGRTEPASPQPGDLVLFTFSYGFKQR